MSDYLTPRQVETYEALIKKLLQQPHTLCYTRLDMSSDEWDIIKTIDAESRGKVPALVTCSWMASHIRDLITASNRLIEEKETSPGLEKSCTISEAIATVHSLVGSLGATDTLYSILLKIYDHPKVKALGDDRLWLLDIHIAAAIRNYTAKERDGIVKFLKGFPLQQEPGNDF